MSSFFDLFKETIRQLASDPEVLRRNALLANTSFRDQFLAHVDGLTPDYTVSQRLPDVDSVTGAWLIDRPNNAFTYDQAHPVEESIVTFRMLSFPVALRVRDVNINGNLPFGGYYGMTSPQMFTEYRFDPAGDWYGMYPNGGGGGPSPDFLAPGQIQLRMRLVLNGQQPGNWQFYGVNVYASQV